MERILIVRLGAMGDILHALPAVVALHQAKPDAQICWLIERRWKELLPPFVVPIEVDTRAWRKNWRARSTRTDLKRLRACGRHSFAIDLQGSTKSAALAKWMRPGFLLGPVDPREWPARFFYHGMIETQSEHVIDRAFEIVGAACDSGLPTLDRRKCDPFTPARSHTYDQNERIAILNPGAGWPAKQWPQERYTEMARRLITIGMKPLVNVGPGEESLGRTIAEHATGAEVVAASITGLIELLRRTTLFVGGDTGPMHLAAMMGVPTVAIFGPTDPVRNGPYYEKTIVVRSPSSKTSYSHTSSLDPGLQQITVDEVMSAVDQVMR